MPVMARLEKSLDEPGSFKVSDGYLRLAVRIMYIIIVPYVPGAPHINAKLSLGIAGFVLVVVSI